MNRKKKLSLRHPLPSFGSFSFSKASRLRFDNVLQKLTKSYKSKVRHLFQCCILISRKCLHKIPFQHSPGLPKVLEDLLTLSQPEWKIMSTTLLILAPQIFKPSYDPPVNDLQSRFQVDLYPFQSHC